MTTFVTTNLISGLDNKLASFIPSCSSLSDLRNLDTNIYSVAYLKEEGRSGYFLWNGADVSDKIILREVTTSTVNTSTGVFALRQATTTIVDPDTDVATSIAHGLQNNDRVASTTTVNGLTANYAVFIVNATSDTFQLSMEENGIPIGLSGSTNFTIRQIIPISRFSPVIVTADTADLNTKSIYYTVFNSRYDVKLAATYEDAVAGNALTITDPTNVTFQVLRDDLEAVYIVPNDLMSDGSEGAWVRKELTITPALCGAVADCITFADVNFTAGSTNITANHDVWTEEDVGKRIVLRGGRDPVPTALDTRNRILSTVITGFNNSRSIEIATSPDVTLTYDPTKPYATECSFGTDNAKELSTFFRLLEGSSFRGEIDGAYGLTKEMGIWSGTNLTWLPSGDIIWLGDTVFNGAIMVAQTALGLRTDEHYTRSVRLVNPRINASLQPNANGIGLAFIKELEILGGYVRNTATGAGSNPLTDFSYGGSGLGIDGVDGVIVIGTTFENCVMAVKTAGNNLTTVRNIFIDVIARECAVAYMALQKDEVVPAVSPKQTNGTFVRVQGSNVGARGGNSSGEQLGLYIADRANYGVRTELLISNNPDYPEVHALFRGLHCIGNVVNIEFNGDCAHYGDWSQLPTGWITNSTSAITERLRLSIKHPTGSLSGAMFTGANAGPTKWAALEDRSVICAETRFITTTIIAGDLVSVSNLFLDILVPMVQGRGIKGWTANELAIGGNSYVNCYFTAKTGWGVPTGTLARTTFAVKTAADMPISPTYSDIQMAALRSEIILIEQRLAALITDLHGNPRRILST